MVLRSALHGALMVSLALIPLAQPTNSDPFEHLFSNAPREDEALLKRFLLKLEQAHTMPESNEELERDAIHLKSRLQHLLSFAERQPAGARTLLEKALMRCLCVLAQKENGWQTVHSPAKQKKQQKAVDACKKAFIVHCQTPEELLSLASILDDLRTYYAPHCSAFPAERPAPNDKYSVGALIGISLGAAGAVVLLVVSGRFISKVLSSRSPRP